MTINWRIFLTPEFVIGTIVVGLMVNVWAAYIVRLLDWLGVVLPARLRHVKEAESARIQLLTDAATSDHALYAALAAEAGRLHSYQVTQLIGGFACLVMALFLPALGKAGSGRIIGILGAIYLIALGFYQFTSGIDNSRRAQRLDIALRGVQRNLKLPIRD